MSGFVPYLGYRDARAAIAFLERAFGFETLAAYYGDDGKVMHAEMRWGDAVLMLGTGKDEQRKDGDLPPATRGIYLTVDDLDPHFERAKAAGATVVWEPHDTEFGTMRYRVLDPEGYEWSFGTYAPGTPAPPG